MGRSKYDYKVDKKPPLVNIVCSRENKRIAKTLQEKGHEDKGYFSIQRKKREKKAKDGIEKSQR